MAVVGADINTYFFPAMREIASITQAFPAVVTTTFAHGYVDGIIMRLYIPTAYGMTQANFQSGVITVLSPTSYSIDLDTRGYDSFIVPAPNPNYLSSPATCVPYAEINSTLQAAFRNILTPLF